MRRISIWIFSMVIAFAYTGLVAAFERVDGEEMEYLEPTELSSKALQGPYLQALEAAGMDDSGYSISVMPNSVGFPDISLTVTIRDAEGNCVKGLTADDVVIFEQSTTESAAVSQELTCFHETVSGDPASSFAIAIDVSGSMGVLYGGELEEAKSAANEFIANTTETDRASLISFSSGGSEKILLPVGEAHTDANNDGTLDIVEAVNGLTASDGTAAFDGTALAIESLAMESNPKAVIVFSDGKTNDDRIHDINSLIEKAGNEGVPVFPIVFGASSTTMENIADLTGGACFYADTALDMAEIYQTIAGIIHAESSYTLCYTTHNPVMDGTTRTVTVQYGPGEGTGFYTVNFAPVITRDEATRQLGNRSQIQGAALIISGEILDTDAATDPEQALDAELFYRQMGTTTYSTLSLALDEGEDGAYYFSQDIPGEQVLEPGMEYYFYASDQVGGTFAPVLYENQPFAIQVYDVEHFSGQPTADAGGDVTVTEGNRAALDGTASTDPDVGDTLTYEWVQTEGIPVELTGASGQQPEFLTPQVGPEGALLTFVLTVTDIGTNESTDTVTISVTDTSPEAAFSWSPESQTAGEPVAFTDSSTAAVDEIVSREWQFGDDGTGTGETPSFTFEEAGSYSVVLTVTDSDGSTDTVTHLIDIEGCPNGDCDPGGGCFISESMEYGNGHFATGAIIVLGMLLLFRNGFRAHWIHFLKRSTARARGNHIFFTMFTGMILAAVLLTVAPETRAEVREDAFTLSPMVGGYMFDAEEDIEEGPVYGLGLGYNFTKNWAVRLYGHYGQFDHPYWGVNTCGCLEEEVDATILQGDIVYHLWPEKQLVPYLAAGAGYLDLDFDDTGRDSSATLNYGGGIKYFLNRNLALKANVRHIYRIEDSMSNMIANVGLEFQFGGSKQKVAQSRPVEEPPKAIAPAAKPSESEAKTAAPVASEPEVLPAAKPEPLALVLRIRFGFDSAKIDPAYHEEIEQAVQFLNDHPGVDAVIEGHACSMGPEQYNMKISKKRAESVKTYMINNFNVGAERLSTMGYGESRPAHDNGTLEGRRLNRRVVIRLEEE